MPQEILDLLARLPELNDDELSDLESQLVDEFDRVDGETKTTDNVTLLGDIATAIDNVRTERTTRESTAEENERAAAELRSRVHAEATDEEGADGEGDDAGDGEEGAEGGDAEGAGEGEGGDADGGEGAEGTDEDGEGTPEARRVAASTARRTAASAGRRQAVPARPTLRAAAERRPAAARPGRRAASSDGGSGDRITTRFFSRRPARDIALGEDLTDRMQLATIEADLASRIVASAGTGEMLPTYGVQYSFPEQYDLRSPGGKGNLGPEDVKRKMDDTIPQSLIASGGICNPVDVDYSVPVFSVNDEPVYDSLPKYQANRGGLRFIAPPTLGGTSASGFTVWTQAIDAAPGTATKTRQVITCAAEQEVFVDALVTRVLIGNMMSRFNPEIVDANQSLIAAKHAQQRELYLLNKINAASTVVSSGQLLGASRDLLGTMDLVASAYRWRSRLSRNTTLHVIMPEWVIDMLRADLLREMAHGEDVNVNFALTDADVEAMLRVRNINVTWAYDGVAANAGAGYGYQGFAAQPAGAAAVDWPRQISWNLFAEGSFQVIDGGELNVGVVRDSTLNNTNDYEQFNEVFRNVAYRGFEALQVVSTVRPNGLSAGTKDTTTY